MEAPHRSNGSNTRPATQALPRGAGRSKVAGRVDRVLNTALAGEKSAVLNVSVPELLSDAVPVAGVIQEAVGRPGVGVIGHWMVQELFRRSSLYDGLIDSLASPNPTLRAAAARVCSAARMTDSVLWIGDLLDDPDPGVRDAAVRALSRLGGRRSVDLLMAGAGRIPLYRLAIALSRAASDIDIEALMRQPASEKAAVATVLACGLRRDVLRVSPLLGIAHDRRWPGPVRLAACTALATIGDRSAADGLHRLALGDPDAVIKTGADRAYRRLVKRAVGR
ncbi:MAG: hypothetical protein E6I50_02065 [Chloroflexi bacterium]|nr:MAG: hypothetical protein E6I50_02065 [Chloroflexota bacterium]